MRWRSISRFSAWSAGDQYLETPKLGSRFHEFAPERIAFGRDV